MKSTRKLISLLLAAMMLSSTLAACSGSPDAGSDDTSTAVPETSAPVTTEPEETKIPSGLPESMDLDGYTVTFIGKEEEGLVAEEETGDVVNDAIYARNRALSEAYDFSIVEIVQGDLKQVKEAILADDDVYQVLVNGGNPLVSLLTANQLYDMNQLKYQDFEQPWWFDAINDDLSLLGETYMASSAFMLTSRTWLYHLIANKDVLKDNGVDVQNLYQMVRDGKWTLDEFLKVAKVGSADLDGDGKRTHLDRWGHMGEPFAGYALAAGCGFDIARKDDKDIPVITANEKVSIDTWDKLLTGIFEDRNSYICIQASEMPGVENIWKESKAMMSSGRIVFYEASLTKDYREFECDYAILPNPKLTEEQENYRHTGSPYGLCLLAVPVSVKDIDNVSFILEAMAYTSYYDVLPLYYENFLENKLARDKDSVEMLQIIHNTIYMDPGAVYNLGGYLEKLCYVNVKERVNNIASYDAANRAAAEKAITDLIAAVQKSN